MGKLISRFDKNKPLNINDLVSSGIACQLLYTHAKTLNEWVDSGIVPAYKANQRTRWGDGDSSSWRVFRVSALLMHATVKRLPVDESMLVKHNDPLKLVRERYNKVFCYGYNHTQTLGDKFELIDLRGIFRILELCPIVPILIGPNMEAGRAIELAEELLQCFDPLDLTIWRQYDLMSGEQMCLNDYDYSGFKQCFMDLTSAREFFQSSELIVS